MSAFIVSGPVTGRASGTVPGHIGTCAYVPAMAARQVSALSDRQTQTQHREQRSKTSLESPLFSVNSQRAAIGARGVAQRTSRMHHFQPSDVYQTGSKVDEPLGSSTQAD